MPGAGKSTVGIILAKMTARAFVDTDVLIQLSEKHSLQKIVDTKGHMALRGIEAAEIMRLHCDNHVIATGGSAVYSQAAMEHLASLGSIVFLYADLDSLKSRIRNFDSRGLAKRTDQTFEDLFNERLPLYKQYAELTVNSSELSQEDVCSAIIEKLSK
jgi:shikimate kinase